MRAPLLHRRLPAVALLLVAGAAVVYLAFEVSGPAAGAPAIAALAFAAVLVLRVQPGTVDSELVGRLAQGGVLALPGVMTIYLSFTSGGYFPGAPALVAIVLLVVLVLRTTLSEEPFAGFGLPLAIAAGAFAIYAAWVLLSGVWSDAPARALLEFDRALVYLLALVLFGAFARTSDRLRWMVRGLALGIVVVAVCGLITRVLPDVWTTAPSVANQRLSYPLTYWNALGILAVVGTILCLHLTTSLREPVVVRGLAAGALPLLAPTVLFTFSRGAIGAGTIGLIAYLLLARPRGLLAGAIAAVPATVIAVVSAYNADLLATRKATTEAAIAQGHDVALVVALCALAAAGMRLALVRLDRRVLEFQLPADLRTRVKIAAWSAPAVVTLVVLLALGAPGWIADQYDAFVTRTSLESTEDRRARLLDPANNGRIDEWKVAMRGYRAANLRGQGAGTYELYWEKERPKSLASLVVHDAHSLYPETLNELGLVGLALLAVTLLAILASFAPVGRGDNRSLYAALFAAGLAWVIHAGVDWDWEMPAVSAWVFMLGGAALATHQRRSSPAGLPVQRVRVVLGVLLLAAAVAPGVVLVSQRRLDESVDAFDRGDCRHSVDAAASSISALAIRPEPYEILGLCHIRDGSYSLATEAMSEAIDRDPDNWEFRYGLALARGAGKTDAQEPAQAARRLNPHEELTAVLVNALRSDDPGKFEQLATSLGKAKATSVIR